MLGVCFCFYWVNLPYHDDVNRMLEKNTTDKGISQYNINIRLMPLLALSLNVYFTVALRNIAFVLFHKENISHISYTFVFIMT